MSFLRGHLHLDGWEGRTKQAVLVVDETPTRYRITPASDERVKLGGRSRWLAPGKTALVPKRAVNCEEEKLMDFWNETERGIWTSAFAARFATSDSGEASAKVANKALLAYREMRAGPDYRSAAEPPPIPSPLKVGVCVMLWRGGLVLMGERLGSHGANTWSFPGGHVEGGETPLEAACREVWEEAGIVLLPPVEPVTFTSDVFEVEGKRYVTLYFSASCPEGVEPAVFEPTKCGGWKWVRWGEWPGELFLPIKNLLAQKSKLFPPPRGEK